MVSSDAQAQQQVEPDAKIIFQMAAIAILSNGSDCKGITAWFTAVRVQKNSSADYALKNAPESLREHFSFSRSVTVAYRIMIVP